MLGLQKDTAFSEKEMMNIIFFIITLIFAAPAFPQVVDPSFLTFAPANTGTSKAEGSEEEELAESYYVKKPELKKVVYEQENTEEENLSLSPDRKKFKSSKKRRPAQKDSTDGEQGSPNYSTQEGNQGFSDKMKDILLGGDLEKMDQLRVNLENGDTRKNIFDLSVGTFYLYNTSQSNYYFRNYLASAPGAFVNLNLWVTPFLGFNTDYRFTLLNSIKDGPIGDSFITANQDWLSFGLKFRRFFGSAVDSSSFTFYASYFDHKMDVPASSTYRMKLRTHGPELGMELSTPSSKRFFWNFGIGIKPYATHEETTNTTDIRTGSGNQTVGISSFIGGEYKMSRKMRTFFKFSAELNRNQFSGNAFGTDPVSNTTPSNVIVNDAFYFFNIGLTFGY